MCASPCVELQVAAACEARKGINVSTVVAVGDQSHGKSSVMEALSGVELPRGEGMKTKLPLSLKLRDSSEDGEEYAMIGLASGEEKAKKRINFMRLKIQSRDKLQRPWTVRMSVTSKRR